MKPRKADRSTYVAYLAFLLAFSIHAGLCYPFLVDDALISLTYAQRLLDGHGLTWTDGVRVEGYTNLGWVLLNALLGFFGMDLVVASRSLGLLCSALVGWVVLRLDRPETESSPWERASALALLAFATPMAAWSIAGLEQPLIALCLAAALLFLLRLAETPNARARDAVAPGLAFACMCLTRPDSPLFVASALGSLLVARRIRGSRLTPGVAAILVGLPLLAYLGQLGFRLAYYGEWVPNTALVKAKPSVAHLLVGLGYLGRGGLSLLPLVAAALAGTVTLYRARRLEEIVVLVTPALVWSAYLVVIGGDVFASYRHFVPLVVIAVFVVARASGEALRRVGPRRYAFGLVSLLLAMIATQAASSRNRQVWRERWVFQGRELALVLGRAFHGREPLVAVTAAGCIPYWTGFPAVDMLGLNDRHLARNPPRTFGHGMVGHELGSGSYVLSREPDLIVFHTGRLHDAFLSGREMQAMPEFHRRYVPVRIEVPSGDAYTAIVWMRRGSPRVGMFTGEDGMLHVPGHLLATTPASISRLDAEGRLVAHLSREAPLRVDVPAELLPSTHPSVAPVEGAEIVTTRLASGDLRVSVSTSLPGGTSIRELHLRR